jgi:hypothetical protein
MGCTGLYEAVRPLVAGQGRRHKPQGGKVEREVQVGDRAMVNDNYPDPRQRGEIRVVTDANIPCTTWPIRLDGVGLVRRSEIDLVEDENQEVKMARKFRRGDRLRVISKGSSWRGSEGDFVEYSPSDERVYIRFDKNDAGVYICGENRGGTYRRPVVGLSVNSVELVSPAEAPPEPPNLDEETLKESLVKIARRLQKEKEWCEDGINKVLRDIDLDLSYSKNKLEIVYRLQVDVGGDFTLRGLDMKQIARLFARDSIPVALVEPDRCCLTGLTFNIVKQDIESCEVAR